MHTSQTSRRELLKQSSLAGLALTAGGLKTPALLQAAPALQQAAPALQQAEGAAPKQPLPKGKAEHCVMIWLGGGPCHIDTFDPKKMGDAKAKKAGSYYPAIDTAIAGTKVCEHLPRCANILDRFNIIRSVHHEVIDDNRHR